MPWRARSRDVMRVSSAAIVPTSPSTRTARAVTSSRLPIGVATTNNRLTCLPAVGGGPDWLAQLASRGWGDSLFQKPITDAVGNLPRRADESRRWRQHVEKRLAIVASKDPVVEDDHGAAVTGPADEAAESLLQTQGRLGQGELRERVANALRTGGVHRIGGNREGEADHDHTAQALPGNVDPLPEARRPEQERALGLLEGLEQLPALAVDALGEDEHIVKVDAVLQGRVHIAQLAVRGEQDERPPAYLLRERGDDPLDADIEVFVLGRGQVGGQADERLVEKVERRRQDELFGLGSEPNPGSEVVERPAHSQRCRCEHRRPSLRVDAFAQQRADIDRRRSQD